MALFGAKSDSCFVRRPLDYISSGSFFLAIRAAYACWILNDRKGGVYNRMGTVFGRKSLGVENSHEHGVGSVD